MIDLTTAVGAFFPISLEEMDDVNLQNRIDTKFVLPVNMIFDLLDQLLPYYRMLEVDGTRIQPYDSLYFDDALYSLYTAHHNRHGHRFKVRIRQYVNSQLSYLEVKHKTPGNRTIKHRQKTTGLLHELPGDLKSFIATKASINPDDLRPSSRITFNRITLVNKEMTERLTLDTELTISSGTERAEFHSMVVAELKQGSKSPSLFRHIMREQRIRPLSISKYALAIYTLVDKVKKNSFKLKHHLLKKINK